MPKTVGPWKLGEQIRRGGQGRVFEATRDEGTVAAVKVIELSWPKERGGITDVSEAADIYALGKLLHFMITSRRLEREKLSHSFQESEIKGDARLAIVRDELLAKMIVEDPSKRVQSADEIFKIGSEILDSFKRRS